MTPLAFSVRFSFGIGQMAEGIKNSAFSAFLLFYYNQVLGLPAELAGLALAISLIFDAVTDPAIGTISDRWKGPRGRRHPFMYASAVPVGVCFYLLFAPASFATEGSEMALFAWMLTFTVLSRAAMTLYHVPHLALGAELSSDYDERTSLVALRQFCSASGYLLVFGLGFGYFFAPTEAFENGQLNRDAYPPFAFILGVVSFVTIFWSAWGTRSRIPHLPPAPVQNSSPGPLDVIKEAVATFGNRSFLWMMTAYLIIVAAFGFGLGTQVYVLTFFWELSRFQIMLVLLTGPVGSLIGYAVASRFFAWLDKRNAMLAGAMLWMALQSLPVCLYLLGVMPEKASWPVAIALTVNYLLLGAAIAQVFVGLSSAMADIADEYELQIGKRQEGVLFGAVSFAGKCTGALGSLIAGFVLAWIEWPTGEEIRSAADIAPETVLNLALVAGPAAALCAIPGLWCLLQYGLNRARMAEIQGELRARGEAGTAPG